MQDIYTLSKFIHTYCEEVLIVNISENRVMNIYARIRKVINIYKIWKKKKKKIFRWAHHTRHFARPLPLHPFF